jgi:hypothetical protein
MVNIEPMAAQNQEVEIEALRQKWDEGKASGMAGSLDMRQIINEARSEKTAYSTHPTGDHHELHRIPST